MSICGRCKLLVGIGTEFLVVGKWCLSSVLGYACLFEGGGLLIHRLSKMTKSSLLTPAIQAAMTTKTLLPLQH